MGRVKNTSDPNNNASTTKFPPLITHPSHPGHTLSLKASPLYPSGKFTCNACNLQGDGFSYHCKACEFDLHDVCAAKPLKISHQLHPCKLELMFQNPYENSTGFSCDVCSKMGSNQWLYRCNGCEFDVHLGCVSATRSTIQAPVVIQHQNSFPGATIHSQGVGFVRPMHQMHSASIGASSMYQNQFQAPINASTGMGTMSPFLQMHSASTGSSPKYINQFQAPTNAFVGVGTVRPALHMHNATMGASPIYQTQFQVPVAADQVYGTVMPNQFMHSASTGSMLNYQPPVMTFQNNQGSRTDGLMNAAMQGLVEGAAQQVGSSLMQGVIGGVFGDSSDGQNQ